METLLRTIKKLIPASVFSAIQPMYHKSVALMGAWWYSYPSRELFVIGVTGTKGKSSTAEMINALLEEAGYVTALAGTIHFKIAGEVRPNLYKMTMPGRFVLQQLLREAREKGATHAVIEMTSEGARQFRHVGIDLDMLVFTNLSPEHIESHGSFEEYKKAKLSLLSALETSPKALTWVLANADDAHGMDFMNVEKSKAVPFSIKDAEPHALNERGILLTWRGTSIHSPLLGLFNLSNLVAALTVGDVLGINTPIMKRTFEKLSRIEGRVERIDGGQNFSVYVDYAHTADSLTKLYQTFQNRRLVCVLGNTGGGRDRWKRPEMGKIADTYCDQIILTDEDPYDEDPKSIVEDVASGIKEHEPEIIMDRREAIKRALARAEKDDVVLITGKGTDPYIMGPNGTKTPWSDAKVVAEELEALTAKEIEEV